MFFGETRNPTESGTAQKIRVPQDLARRLVHTTHTIDHLFSTVPLIFRALWETARLPVDCKMTIPATREMRRKQNDLTSKMIARFATATRMLVSFIHILGEPLKYRKAERLWQ